MNATMQFRSLFTIKLALTFLPGTVFFWKKHAGFEGQGRQEILDRLPGERLCVFVTASYVPRLPLAGCVHAISPIIFVI